MSSITLTLFVVVTAVEVAVVVVTAVEVAVVVVINVYVCFYCC